MSSRTGVLVGDGDRPADRQFLALSPPGTSRRGPLRVAGSWVEARSGATSGWCDVVSVPGDRAAVVVGDVTGSRRSTTARDDLRASLRSMLETGAGAAESLRALGRVAASWLAGETAALGVLVADPTQLSLTWASAGQGPLLVLEAGTPRFLDVPLGAPFGDGRRRSAVREVPVAGASTVVMVSRAVLAPDAPADAEARQRVRRSVANGPRDPERLCRHLADSLAGAGSPGEHGAIAVVQLRAPRREV